MFISNAEKDQIKYEIDCLKANVKDLTNQVNWLRGLVKGGTRPALSTTDAPYGLKKNGDPRKRMGRPPRVMEVGQP
jgi:hypothetical protein